MRRLGFSGLALSLAGCLGGPASTVYVMSVPLDSDQSGTSDSSAPTDRRATSEDSAPALRVDIVSVPTFLDNSEILIRRGPHALDSSSTGHWGERLSLGITHALAADLTSKLPGYRISLGRSGMPSGRQLQVEVDSFDVYPDGHCVLAASWVVVQKSGGAPAFGRGVFATPASAVNHADDAGLVRAMAATVTELADAIVRSI